MEKSLHKEPTKENKDPLNQSTNQITVFSFSNSKVSNSLQKIKYQQLTELDVFNGTYTTLSLAPKEQQKDLAQLNSFDLLVHDAIITMWKEDNKCFTLNQVWQVIHQDKNLRPTKKNLEAISMSLFKMDNLFITIDATNEVLARKDIKNKDIKKVYTSERILDTAPCMIKTKNGKVINGYQIKKVPVIYEYEQNTNHQLLQTYCKNIKYALAGLKNTDENAVLSNLILKHIARLEHPKAHISNRMKYETLFNQIGRTDLNRMQEKRIKDNIISILQNLVNTNSCSLVAFKEVKESNKRVAVDLFVTQSK